MIELKNCPNCNGIPRLTLDTCSCNGSFYLECKCGIDASVKLSTWEIPAIIAFWNSYVEELEGQLQIQNLPKTLDEALIKLYEKEGTVTLFGIRRPDRAMSLYNDLRLLANIYNDGWTWDGKSDYYLIDGIATGTMNSQSGYIKFKSREIAQEFLNNFGNMLQDFYSL